MMNNAFAQKSMQVQILQPIPFDRNFPRVGEVWGKFLGIIYWIWMIMMLTMLVIPTKGLEKVNSPPPKTNRDVSLTLLVLLHLLQANVMVHVCTTRGKSFVKWTSLCLWQSFSNGLFHAVPRKKSESPTIKTTQPLQLPAKTVMKPWRKTRESSFSQVEVSSNCGWLRPISAASIPSAFGPSKRLTAS